MITKEIAAYMDIMLDEDDKLTYFPLLPSLPVLLIGADALLKFYSTHSELQMEFTNWHSCTTYSVICEIIHSQRVAEPVSTNSR